uniref:PiggyBac transposable element-derived protein domain-containing protein n=1 Tax=Octopus bimaculoides TaxID=37653 RepID=A0A0L8GQM5_OCTBM
MIQPRKSKRNPAASRTVTRHISESESEYSDALDKNYIANTSGNNISDTSSTDEDEQLVARGRKRQDSSLAPTSSAPTASTSNTWSNAATNPPNFPFTTTPRLKTELNTNTIEVIDQFLTDEFWTVLVEETNAYAMQILDQQQGKQDAPTGILGHLGQVVLSLMDEFLDKGYILYTDNYYNSVPLTKKEESEWIRSDKVVVCKWKDKRDVLIISNMHQVEMVDVINHNGKKSKKPNIVRDYNNGMSGVGRPDQKTLCWYKKIGLHIFEILIHNAHKVYCKVENIQMTLVKFRDNIVLHFLGEHIQKETPVPTVDFHYLEAIPPTEKKQRPTKPCRVCT